MTNVTIRISDELRRQLKELCRQRNRPASEVVRDFLRRYSAAERFQALRRMTLPFAEAQGFLTDEDISGAVS
jgi:predicted transcriptional regulator